MFLLQLNLLLSSNRDKQRPVIVRILPSHSTTISWAHYFDIATQSTRSSYPLFNIDF